MPDPTASPAASTEQEAKTPAAPSTSSIAPRPTASQTEPAPDDASTAATEQPSAIETSQAQDPAQDGLPGVTYWGAG